MQLRSIFICALFIPFLIHAQVASVKLTVHVPSFAQSKYVYVSGSFNNWKAGDSLYRMKKLNATTYTIKLPVFKNVRYTYKYTLGNWNEVEVALSNNNINNRSFVSAGRKKISDTVAKWAEPKPSGQAAVNPKMIKIIAMKDSVLAGLQPKLNEMLQLLKDYAINLLQEKPDAEVERKIVEQVNKHLANAHQKLNEFTHKVFESLTPEQKQQILKAINSPEGDKDFINTFIKALSETMKEKAAP